ncbi:AAEL017271-PA, partial [Aedes aegypti]
IASMAHSAVVIINLREPLAVYEQKKLNQIARVMFQAILRLLIAVKVTLVSIPHPTMARKTATKFVVF